MKDITNDVAEKAFVGLSPITRDPKTLFSYVLYLLSYNKTLKSLKGPVLEYDAPCHLCNLDDLDFKYNFLFDLGIMEERE